MKKTKTETLPFYVIAQYQVVRKSKIETIQKEGMKTRNITIEDMRKRTFSK